MATTSAQEYEQMDIGTDKVIMPMPSTEINHTPTEFTSASPGFYVIVGVYEVAEYAHNMLSQLKEEGYTNCSSLVVRGRITVYSNHLSTAEEAYKARKEMIKQNYKYNEAWVLER